jgi:hypothetical protein
MKPHSMATINRIAIVYSTNLANVVLDVGASGEVGTESSSGESYGLGWLMIHLIGIHVNLTVLE